MIAGGLAAMLVLVLGLASVFSDWPAPSPKSPSAVVTVPIVSTSTPATGAPAAEQATDTVARQPESTPATDATGEIRAVLFDRWAAGVNNHNLDQKMSAYADVVSPFFGRTRATKAEIRKVFASPFARWRKMRQRIERTDIKVTGDKAVVVLYKTWDYDGHPGWAEERIGFTRTSLGWRITSEQDIRASG